MYCLPACEIWPPLGEYSFPVHLVSKKTARRSVGIFFFLISCLYKLECTGKGKKKIKYEKKSSSRPFLVHSGSRQEKTFHLRVAFAVEHK